MQFLDPLQFWEIFSAAMNENPPPATRSKRCCRSSSISASNSVKPWKRENVQPQILNQMKSAAEQIGPMMMPLLPLLGVHANGWNIPPANVGMPGTDYPGRALVAVFGLTSNTTRGGDLLHSVTDGAGKKLTGTNGTR